MNRPSENGFETVFDFVSALEEWATAAARADALAEIRAGVEGLAHIAGFPEYVSRAAVLALLDPPK